MFQQRDFEISVDGQPPRALIAVERARRRDGANFIALHATDADSAGALCDLVPRGFAIIHLTEEFPLALLEPRAEEFPPHSAWLMRPDLRGFVDHPDERVPSLCAGMGRPHRRALAAGLARRGYVRRRIVSAPTAAIYEDGEPVAWAVIHMVTDHVGIIGIVDVVDGHRRKGLARSVVSAICRDLTKLGKVPTLHAFVDNAASLALFPSLGFRQVKRQAWGDAVFR